MFDVPASSAFAVPASSAARRPEVRLDGPVVRQYGPGRTVDAKKNRFAIFFGVKKPFQRPASEYWPGPHVDREDMCRALPRGYRHRI